MLNIELLEKRQKKYQFRKKIPYIIGFSTLLLILILVLLYLFLNTEPLERKNTKQVLSSLETTLLNSAQVKNVIVDNPLTKIKKAKTTKKIEEKKIEIQKYIAVEEESTVPNVIPKKNISPKPTVLEVTPIKLVSPSKLTVQYFEPSFNFLNHLKNLKNETKVLKNNESIPSISQLTVTTKIDKPKSLVQKTSVVSATSKNGMIINKKRDKQDISKIIERFKEDKNPKLSLFIAKHYYTNKEYYRAYNYALTTNKLNPNLEDSWIIFVKSLYKLDQVDRAISTLQTYTKHSDSQKAEILLIQFKEGKFE